MLLECGEVVTVEGGAFQPLDGAEEEDLLGDGRAIRADDVDLDGVRPVPVAADRRGGGEILVGEQPGQGLPQ
jgi:hypothetical protein